MPTGSPDRRKREPDVRRRARERSLGGCDRAVPRVLVLPEARERRGSEAAVLRELEEVDLREDLRAGPEGQAGVQDLGLLVEGEGRPGSRGAARRSPGGPPRRNPAPPTPILTSAP